MANPDILITPGQGTIGFSGTNTGTIQLRVAESGDIHFEGDQGSLLSLSDDLSDSLFSVNDAAGMPVFEVFADDTIKAYRNNETKLEIDPDNNRVRVRDNLLVSGNLTVSGDITSASASHEATSYTASTHVSGLSGYFGKVGIGSSANPDNAQLYIAHGPTSVADVILESAAGRKTRLSAHDGTNFLHVGSASNHDFQIVRNNVIRIAASSTQTTIWDSTPTQVLTVIGGKLGVMEATPEATLQVNGDASITGELRVKEGIYVSDGDSLGSAYIQLGNSNDYTNFTSAQLHLAGGTNAGFQTAGSRKIFLSDYDNDGSTNGVTLFECIDENQNVDIKFLGGSGGSQVGRNYFRGTVGIGTETPQGVDLHVNGSAIVSGTLFVKNDQIWEDANSKDIIAKLHDNNDDGIFDIYQNNNVVNRIHGNGVSYITGGNLAVGTTTSDNALSIVMPAADSSNLFDASISDTNAALSVFKAFNNGSDDSDVEIGKFGVARSTFGASTDWAGHLKFFTHGGITTPNFGSERFRLTWDGNGRGYFGVTSAKTVGIYAGDNKVQITSDGTQNVAPQATLVVSGDASISGELKVGDGTNGSLGVFGNGHDKATLQITNAGSSNARLLLNSNHGNWSVCNSDTVGDALEFRDESASSTRMIIDSAGEVGIGTTDPGDKLHIHDGHLLFTRGVELRSKDTGGSVKTIARVNSSNELEYGWSSNGPVKFMGGGSYTERMRIHTNGNIGIGTEGSSSELTISGSDGRPTIRLAGEKRGSDSNFADIYATNNGADGEAQISFRRVGANDATEMLFYTSAAGGSMTEQVRIDSAGNVGIGTDNPATLLHIHADSSSSQEIFFDNNGVGSVGATFRTDFATDGGLANFIRFDAADSAGNNTRYSTIESFIVDNTDTTEDGRLTFSTMVAGTDTETMHITKGTVGIGTNNPDGQLHVKGSTNKTIKLDATVADGSSSYTSLAFARNGNDKWRVFGFGDDRSLSFYNENTSSFQLTLKSDGNVGIGTASPATILEIESADPILQIRDTESTLANAISKIRIGESSGSDTINNAWDICASGEAAGLNLDFIRTNAGTKNKHGITLKYDGKVGIGTASPDSSLHIKNSDFVVLTLEDSSGGTQKATIKYDQAGQNTLTFATQFQSFNSQNRIQFAPADNIAMTIRGGTNTAGDGTVGIGTQTPTGTLHVYQSGDIRPAFLVEGSQGSLFSVEDTLTGSLMSVNDIAGLPVFEAFDDGTIVMGQYNSGDLVVTGNKVGIGTNSPNKLLELAGGGLRLPNGNSIDWNNENTRILGSHNSNKIQFDVGGVSNVLYLSNGNVGIGTTTPHQILNIYQAADGNQFEGALKIGGVNANVGAFIGYNGLNSGRVSFTNLNDAGGSASTIKFGFGAATDGSPANQVLTINQAGKVGIGTTDPDAKLHVNGDIVIPSDSYLYFEGDSDDGFNRIGRNDSENAILTTSRFHIANIIDSNNDDTDAEFSIRHNGTTIAGSTSLFSVNAGGTSTFNGDVSVTGTLAATNIKVATDIIHLGDSNTSINFASDFIRLQAGGHNMFHVDKGNAEIVLAENSNVTAIDIRMESNNKTHMFFLEGSTDRVGIGTDNPAAALHVHGNSDNGDDDCQLVISDADSTAGSKIPSLLFRSLNNAGSAYIDTNRIRGTKGFGMQFSTETSSEGTLGTAMILDNSQRVGIGRANGAISGILHVENSNTGIIVANEQITGNAFEVFGAQGNLLTVTDDLSDSLFSVNDAAGMPVFEVFADDTIKSYRNNESKLEVDPDNNRVRLRDHAFISGNLHISGSENGGGMEIGEWPAAADYGYLGNVDLSHTDVNNYALLQHKNGDTYLNSTSTLYLRLDNASTWEMRCTSSVISVNHGNKNVDFKVNGDSTNNLIYVDAGTETVGIGAAASSAQQLLLKTHNSTTLPFIDFANSDGSQSSSKNVHETSSTDTHDHQGWIKIKVNGVDRYLAFYS